MRTQTRRGTDAPRQRVRQFHNIDAAPGDRKAPEILVTHLMEGIGLALDLPGERMLLSDFSGSVYSANLDGSNKKELLIAQGNLIGIVYVAPASRLWPHSFRQSLLTTPRGGTGESAASDGALS